MPTFTPPTAEGPAPIGRRHPLWRHYGNYECGITVWRGQDGVYRQTMIPYHGGAQYRTFDEGILISDTTDDVNKGLATAREVYLGGSIYQITDQQATDLSAAGYGAFINTAVIDLTNFKTNDLSKFTKWNLTENASAVHRLQVVNDKLRIDESSGTQPIQDLARKFFIHADTAFNTDFDATILMEHQNYGVSGIAEQGGVVLRAQQSGGINSGITINNNIFFVVPDCNIGVWRSNIDGSGFVNRQASIPIGLVVPMPHAYDIKLEGNIITVRVYNKFQAAPAWNDPILAKIVNLDTDAGSVIGNPTPVGDGSAGIIAAHMGTSQNPLVAIDYSRFKVGPRGSLFT